MDPALDCFNDAVRAHQQQDLATAERLYRQALERRTEYPEAHNNLGAVLADTGRPEEAEWSFRRAIQLAPGYGEALNNLGILLSGRGDPDQATHFFERAVATGAPRADWWNHLGNAHLERYRIEEALSAYDRAIAIDPNFEFAHNNRGLAMRGLGRFEEAAAALEEALRIRPEYVEALNNLGLVYRDRGDRATAIEYHERALALDPDALGARINLGLSLQESGRRDEAREVARWILERHPECSDGHDILGHCAYEEGLYEEASRHFRDALAVDPEDANAQWNRALLNLHRGDLGQGFTQYEARKKLVSFTLNRRRTDRPAWDGAPLAGQRVMIFAEQGMGDSIQFIRYAPFLKGAGAGAVFVECDPSLVPLLRTVEGVDGCFPRGGNLPEYDLHVYMLSLPGLVGTTLETIPGEVPYLEADRRPAAELVSAVPGTLRVGLVWAGSPVHARDQIRTLPIERLRPLAELPTVHLYSLQKGPRAAELGALPAGRVTDLGPHLNDFVDTAAVIERLDLVISVDTSVAHLAGALGRPTWVLLPYVSDWRWLLEREDSPWYPTMRLFRQPALDAWEPVIEAVRAALEEIGALGADSLPHARQAAVGPSHRPLSSPNGKGSGPGPGVTEVRSITLRDGRPRFTLEMAIEELASEESFAAFQEELVGTGHERDLRDALDLLLRAGDLFVDASPGPGFACLTAATAPAADVRVLALPEPSGIERLRRQVERNGLGAVVELASGGDAARLLEEASRRTRPGGRAFVRSCDPVSLLATPGGATLLGEGHLAGIFWPSDREREELGRLDHLADGGFSHFRIGRDQEGVYLDPLGETLAAGETVVSLRPALVAELEAGPASPPASDPAPATGVPLLGIDWGIGSTTGWEVYGTHLATQLARRADVQPVLRLLPEPDSLPPLSRHALGEVLARSGQLRSGEGMVALRALGNGLHASAEPWWESARVNVGVIFFEDTRLEPQALERGRRYDRIIAGSSWNAEVLRAHGLEHVEVSLQGIDPTVFHPAPSSDLFGDRFVVFSGGKLEYRKGQDIVVAAFREFQRRHPEALLVFAWHNPWPPIMEEITFGGHVQTVPRADAAGRIRFDEWLAAHGFPANAFVDLGTIPNAQMGAVMREADVGLFPNRCEGGTNLVAMEFMACGLPTVLSANTGHLDLIGTGAPYALERQGSVHPSRHCAGVDGWGESSVEEILSLLERIYTDRAEARACGDRAAAALRGLTWRSQTEHLIETLHDLL